jgi:hypothetical protein
LRVGSESLTVIQAYGGYPDPVAKRGAIFAIAYMGKFADLRQNLKDAVLSIHPVGDESVASDLVDAFGPYGVPLTMLTREEAAAVAGEFLRVGDWDFDQGAIPRFLCHLASLFPDETYHLLLSRIQLGIEARRSGQSPLRTLGLVYGSVSFRSVPAEKRLGLAQDCLVLLLKSDFGEELAELFWDLAGYDEAALQLIVNAAPGADELGVKNFATMIDKAVPRLAFTHTGFVSDFLRQFSGAHRESLDEAFARQAWHLARGPFAGSIETHMAQRQKQCADQAAAFPDGTGLDDLARALRRFT